MSPLETALAHAFDLIDAGECSPQCLLARSGHSGCNCVCGERHHGRLRTALLDPEMAMPCPSRDHWAEPCDLWAGHDGPHLRSVPGDERSTWGADFYEWHDDEDLAAGTRESQALLERLIAVADKMIELEQKPE